ncbi:hypothetical protein GLAREA_04236 [Glarea lozoyensis ATCC 20868]|uniref:Transmembrane protein n=1 Tax=Glarea lozoyensis (strain ATCC 20868 / MF5171) TaxID=1116229 RepID=S3CNZ9_GLAL2|nr:uncharacterized protein GLAREA_04236 [Glarea lozoyensis ATCC 20868]EPE27445.1 hypothetical protein GLAREA_04236 [Glarea lozoyensis ATCC 20868]
MAHYRAPEHEGLQVVEGFGLELATLPPPAATPKYLRVLFADEGCGKRGDERKSVRGMLDVLAAYHADVLGGKRMRRQKILLWSFVVVIWMIVVFGGVYGGLVVKRGSRSGTSSLSSQGLSNGTQNLVHSKVSPSVRSSPHPLSSGDSSTRSSTSSFIGGSVISTGETPTVTIVVTASVILTAAPSTESTKASETELSSILETSSSGSVMDIVARSACESATVSLKPM